MYREGDTVEVTNNIAHGLIDRGIAMISKDVTKQDVKKKKAVKKAVSKPKRRYFRRKK